MKRRDFLKKTGKVTSALAFSPILFGCTDRKIDYLFTNGFVIDGTGTKSIKTDVAVKGDKIVGIGKFENKDVLNVIDIKGKMITPGFIDIHSHTETKLLVNPFAESKITQGVTTEMYGMDGDSAAPLTDEMRENWNENIPQRYNFKVTWQSLPEFFDILKRNKHAVNFGTMIGQGSLRDYVIGETDRPATKDDIKKMQHLLEKAIDEGAWGISSGLEYTPGSFASTEEIIEVASVLKGTNYPYVTHMRSEGDKLIEAVEESIQIAKGAGIPLHISHLKVEGKRNWHKADLLFETIAKAEQEGLRITFDRYPYIAYNTGLSNLFPIWAREGGTDKFLERLNDKKQISEIKKYTKDKIAMLGSWDSCLISTIHSKENSKLQGKRLPEIADIWNCDPFDAAVRLINEERARVSMVGFGMSEENTKRILAHPNAVIASDGSALEMNGSLAKGNPHPRNFGTFPRAIAHYVNKHKIVPLPEMIKKMTSKPAEIAGIKNRGKIAENYFADLVIYSPNNLQDLATFENPKQYCQGIHHLFVNGKPVIFDGKRKDNLPGVILKST
jgi:N-acyl-D-aspartate/D-glutamate deacylase